MQTPKVCRKTNAEVKANKVLSMAIGGAFHAGVEVRWLKVIDDDLKLLTHVPTWTTLLCFLF